MKIMHAGFPKIHGGSEEDSWMKDVTVRDINAALTILTSVVGIEGRKPPMVALAIEGFYIWKLEVPDDLGNTEHILTSDMLKAITPEPGMVEIKVQLLKQANEGFQSNGLYEVVDSKTLRLHR